MNAQALHRAAGVVLAAALLTTLGCGGHSAPAAAPPAKPAGPPRLDFAEGGASLDYADRGVVSHHGAIEVHDVSYATPSGRVDGYLVERPGAAGLPGIVLVHGSGGNRSELLGRAVTLAGQGAVALTITEPSSAHPPPAPTSNIDLLTSTRLVTVEDVVAIRRAGDVLQSLPSVDPSRIGYLGWSNGAKLGAFVAASDPRFHAFALLSGGADPVSAFVAAAPAGLRPKVRTILGSVDPLTYLSFARPGTVLLEDGTRDSIVPHGALENFVHAAPANTVVRWYPTDHALNAAAYGTAFAWLLAKLG